MNRKISACALPSCSCPELELTEDIDGNPIAIITDDYNGIVVMPEADFKRLALRYLLVPGEI